MRSCGGKRNGLRLTCGWGAPLIAVLFACVLAAAGQPADPGYVREVEKIRGEQADDLKSNWVPLVGLFWLKVGVNTFGTDPANAVVVPKGTGPRYGGKFELNGDNVTVTLRPSVRGVVAGKAFTTAEMRPDTSGDPTVLALGRLRIKLIKRGQRLGIRVKDVESPALAKFGRLTYFPIDPAYRVRAKWLPSDGKTSINVPDVIGDVTPTPVAGVARFSLNGQELTLTPVGGDPQKGLFFVFSDATAKSDSYPGGRFLDTGPVKDGTVVLDFNTAYNPPCAVTPYATCPMAPKENRLPVAISAGEKYDRRHAAH